MADYIYGSENNGNENESENRNTAPENGQRPGDGAGTNAGMNGGNGGNGGNYSGYQYTSGPYGNGYGYGYGYGYGQPTPPPKPPKKKGAKTVLVVVSIIVATVLLATAAGVGGYFLTLQNSGDDQDPPTQTNELASNGDGEKQPEDNTSTGVVLKPDSLGTKDKGTIAEVAAKTADSVVEITTEYATSNSFYYTYGAGSGVIINENGYIITNNHVITGDTGTATSITVRLTNGQSYDAKIIGADSDSDIAVLKIEATGLKAATIGKSDSLVVGEEVVIIGNPLGTLGGSVTNGIISALDREITVGDETMNLLQTNAAVNPGNSGGGMFNMAGELVGIVNAKYSETDVEGLGFAIPMDDVTVVANEILEYGYVRGRASFHITVLSVSSIEDMMRYRVNAVGLYVAEAEKGYNDGVLKTGDRFGSVDGAEIIDLADLKAVLKRHSVGDVLDATVIRNGTSVNVKLTCYEKMVGDVNFDNSKTEE